jgi:hypothetical protein
VPRRLRLTAFAKQENLSCEKIVFWKGQFERRVSVKRESAVSLRSNCSRKKGRLFHLQ